MGQYLYRNNKIERGLVNTKFWVNKTNYDFNVIYMEVKVRWAKV